MPYFKFFLKPWNDQSLVPEIRQVLEQYDLVQTNKVLHQKVVKQNEALRQINDKLENLVIERNSEVEIQNQALMPSHAILDNFPVPIIGVGTEKMVVLINKAVHGADKGIQIGRPVSDCVSDGSKEKIKGWYPAYRRRSPERRWVPV